MAFLIFSLSFLAMAAGLLLARKVLRKGCSAAPGETCACKDGRDEADAGRADPSILSLHPTLRRKKG